MKKIAILLLSLCLLTGCTQSGGEPTVPEESTQVTEPTVESETTEPIIQSFYVEGTAMERGTGGAVKVYEIEEAAVTGMAILGENLVLCADGTTLFLLDRLTLEPTTQRELDYQLSWEDPSLVISGNRLAYYDADAKTYIILDENLLSVSSVDMGGLTSLTPVISSGCDTIFFADAEGIRVLDLLTGTSRLLRQEHEQVLSIDGVLFEDSVVRYTRVLSDGTTQTCFIDSQTGQLYSSVPFQNQLLTWGSQYVTILEQAHPLGRNAYLLTGSLNGPSYALNQTGNWDSAVFPGGGLAVLQQENSVGLVLRNYDLNTGTILSQVTMPQLYSGFPYSCAVGDSVWLWNGASGRFYCWNTAATALSVETSALDFYATLEFEDEAGLLRCTQRATTLSKTYGVELTITEEGNRTENVDYSGYADYRPDFYMTALNKMESVLKKFPEGFLQTVAKKTRSGYIKIHLVDDYDPYMGISGGTGNCDLQGKQILLSVSMCQDLEAIFYHELFHAMETRILNTCDDLSNWGSLNPDGFTYGLADNGEYTHPGSNYFTDAQGLTSAREDRAQIFLYAMMEGNGKLFASDAMQAKLSELCRLIRVTYKLSDDAVLPWEQYLR